MTPDDLQDGAQQVGQSHLRLRTGWHPCRRKVQHLLVPGCTPSGTGERQAAQSALPWLLQLARTLLTGLNPLKPHQGRGQALAMQLSSSVGARWTHQAALS